MNLKILVHAETGELFIVHAEDILKYASDYRLIDSLCLYSGEEVCKAFAEFFAKGVQTRISFG